MALNNRYGDTDDGNIRLENGCCANSCASNNSGNMNSSFDKIQQEIASLIEAIDKIKDNCCYKDNNCNSNELHDFIKIIGLLKELKFELNCEFAKRAQEINRLEEIIKKIGIDLKHLDVIRVSKLENIIKKITENNCISNFDYETVLKHIEHLERRVKYLEHKSSINCCPNTNNLNIEEINDELFVNGKSVMVDDYITGGTYDASSGSAILTTNTGKHAQLNNLPKPMTMEDLNEFLK